MLDLLNPELYRQFLAYPERLKEWLSPYPDNAFIIDEVQKVPALLDVVYQAIEMKQNWQFILTGSSARKSKRTGVDLLAGWAQLKYLHPFMAAELKDNFNLGKNLKFGMLPLIFNSSDPLQDLKAYIPVFLQNAVFSGAEKHGYILLSMRIKNKFLPAFKGENCIFPP